MIITKGQTEIAEFTFTDQDDTVVNLTGSTVYYKIVNRAGVEVYSDSVDSFSAPTTGVMEVTITKEDTATFTAGDAIVQVSVLTSVSQKFYSQKFSCKIIDVL